jgi:hypothetical protein
MVKILDRDSDTIENVSYKRINPDFLSEMFLFGQGEFSMNAFFIFEARIKKLFEFFKQHPYLKLKFDRPDGADKKIKI